VSRILFIIFIFYSPKKGDGTERQAFWNKALKEQDRTPDVVEDVIGNGAEQHVPYFSTTLMAANNQELKFLHIRRVTDYIPGFAKFKHKFIGETRFFEFGIGTFKQLPPRFGGIFFHHVHLKNRDHSIGQLGTIDHVEESQVFREVVFELNKTVNGLLRCT
jgi:hypothetical protein